MRRLPPLAALRAFEAAARHLSFKRAAEELLVTPTAISHQIRLLEETLGLKLFERRNRRVAMTGAAQRLFPVLRDGFDSFAATLDELRRAPRRAAVTVSATRAFTAQCLVPRAARFHAAHPAIDLRLHASDDPVDLRAGTVDLAIRYGAAPYAGLDARTLAADRFAPVAHPSLGLARPADLARHPLIHFEWRHRFPGQPDWPRWLSAAGLDTRTAEGPALRFTDESHAIQAAVAGQGVALLSLLLVAPQLESGSLVQPFGPSLPGQAYHLLQAPGEAHRSAVSAVADWLLRELGEPEGRSAPAAAVPARHRSSTQPGPRSA